MTLNAAAGEPGDESEASSSARPASAASEDPGISVRARAQPGAATRIQLRGLEATVVPGTGGEPLRAIASQPGVARSPFGIGFYAVRGSSLENTGFLVDGFEVPVLYHFAGGPSVLPSQFIGALEFYPGGYPVQYGRFSGGLVTLDTRTPTPDRAHYAAELNIFALGLSATTPVANGNGTVSVGVRRSFYDLLLPLVVSGITVNFGDLQLRAEYRFSNRTRVTAFIFGSTDVYDRSATRTQGGASTINRDGINYNFLRGTARLEHRTAQGAEFSIAGMVGADDVGFVSADTGRQDSGVHYGGATAGYRASVRLPAGSGVSLSAGVDGQAYLYDTRLDFPQLQGINVVPVSQSNNYATTATGKITQLSNAFYFDGTIRRGRFDVTAGGRIELLHNNGRSYTLVDPRLVGRVQVHRDATIVYATGVFHQPPPFFAQLPIVGNPELTPQASWQSSVGAEFRLPWSLDARATAFYSQMWGLVRPANVLVETPTGVQRVLLLSDGEGRAYGLELSVRRRLQDRVFGWASYTISRSERWVGDGRVVPNAFDQTHVVNVALSWEINARWRLGGRFTLSSGYPNNQFTGGTYDADANMYRPTYVPEGERLPWFHQLDVRVDYRFRWGQAKMDFYVDALNAYSYRATEGWSYQYDFRQRTGIPGLPILPVVGLRGEL